jgi:hypothetical protein
VYCAAFASVLVLGALTPAARAADLGGDCCADLESRIAELEATAARKGNRKIDLTVAGAVNRAILYWNDEEDRDTYVVNNKAEGSKIEFLGEAEKINDSPWSVGFFMEFGLVDAASDAVDQNDDDAVGPLEIDELHFWVRHEKLGTFSMGEIGGSDTADDATEVDLSGTKSASYAGVEDIGGGFLLRRDDVSGAAGLTPVTWSNLIDHLAGISGSLVRYDSPALAGFAISAEWGEDDQWELGLTFDSDPEADEGDGKEGSNGNGAGSGPLGPFHVAAAISYAEDTDNIDIVGDEGLIPDSKTIAGSFSILHKPTGLNFTFAAANREHPSHVVLTSGEIGTLRDSWFYYLKPGILLDISRLGHTGLYAEYGRYTDFLGRDADAELVEGLAGIPEGTACAASGDACLVDASEATIWGLGIVQHIDDADAELYLGLRHHRAEVDLVDADGAEVGTSGLTDLVTVIGGMLINF